MPYKDPDVAKTRSHASYRQEYDRRKAAGQCIACGLTNDADGVRCSACRDKFKDALSIYQKKQYRSFKASGLCVRCGATRDTGKTVCSKCLVGGKSRRVRANKGRHAKLSLLGLCLMSDIAIRCYNCNCGRARNGGICPHELERKAVV